MRIEQLGFCEKPFIYAGRISPCLIEPILSLLFTISAFSLFYYGRNSLQRRYYLDTAAEDDEEVGHTPTSTSTPRRQGKAKWQLQISRVLITYTLILALLQFVIVVSASSMDDSSDDFYAISTSLVCLAWFFCHSYFCGQAGSVVFLDIPLGSIVSFASLSDIFIIVSRAQMITMPNPHDPHVMDGQIVLDIVVVSIRLLLSLSFLYLGARYNGEGYESVDADDSSQTSAFSNFFFKTSKLSRFIWPKGNLKLQFIVFTCIILLILARVVNFYVPLQFKTLVDSLMPNDTGKIVFPVLQVLIFAGLKLVQGTNGMIDTIRATLWISIEQYTTREVSLEVFQHLHSLSLRWHLNRKTGEVLRVMDRGTAAITNLLSYIFFNITPVLVDIAVAVVYFIIAFDITFGLIVLATMILYLIVTIWITEWRTKYRRAMIDLDNKTNYKAVDALINYETVKYYGNEDFELSKYRKNILQYQAADWVSQLSLKILNSVQNVVIGVGLLVGSLLCVSRIVKGVLTVGDFILFVTYLQQLYMPLNWFGTYYRMINQNFIDMEKMLDLMNEEAEVKDDPTAPELVVTKGHVIFENVSFTYDPQKATKPTISNISFEVPAGHTVALCGPSGAGKSSILRLLFRFFDVSSGRILIDGQDIKEVSQKSLRKAIGVVPQDTVLFNDTLMYNIRYGRVQAGDQDVLKAAEVSQVHDKILSFPDKYDTQVGERGLRLSGGEKQRIAIARTILKDPPIVLLDEATSALDTNTESLIQQELSKMTKERTTLIVAHRLSTIVHADLILVIKEGAIAERGTHEELIKQKGIYHEMWFKQQNQSQ